MHMVIMLRDDVNRKAANPFLGGGFKHFLFSPLLGEMIQID